MVVRDESTQAFMHSILPPFVLGVKGCPVLPKFQDQFFCLSGVQWVSLEVWKLGTKDRLLLQSAPVLRSVSLIHPFAAKAHHGDGAALTFFFPDNRYIWTYYGVFFHTHASVTTRASAVCIRHVPGLVNCMNPSASNNRLALMWDAAGIVCDKVGDMLCSPLITSSYTL